MNYAQAITDINDKCKLSGFDCYTKFILSPLMEVPEVTNTEVTYLSQIQRGAPVVRVLP